MPRTYPGTVSRVYEMAEQAREPIARAAKYVRAAGGPFDNARLAALIGLSAGTSPTASGAWTSQFVAMPGAPQNVDGGWPAQWSAGASSLDATCLTLDQLADFGVPAVAGGAAGTVGAAPEPHGGNGTSARTRPQGAAPAVAAALAFIAAAQLPDGSWTEGVVDDAPGWLMPGSASSKAYLTANCARTLLVYGVAGEAIERAAQLLEWSLDPHGRLPGPAVAHWLAARVFRATGRDLAARRLLDVVGRGFEGFDATDLAWFGSDTQPGDRWTRRVAARLTAIQRPDGSWVDASGVPSPAVTVTACRVLIRAGDGHGLGPEC